MYVCMYVCMYVMYVMYVCMYACMCVCMCVYMCVCVYVVCMYANDNAKEEETKKTNTNIANALKMHTKIHMKKSRTSIWHITETGMPTQTLNPRPQTLKIKPEFGTGGDWHVQGGHVLRS